MDCVIINNDSNLKIYNLIWVHNIIVTLKRNIMHALIITDYQGQSDHNLGRRKSVYFLSELMMMIMNVDH